MRGWVILCCLTTLLSAAGAGDLLQHTSRRAGICVVSQCTDAALLRDLAARSRFLIYADHADAGVVAGMRADLAGTGLLGRRILIGHGSGVPFARGIVDLIHLPPDARKAVVEAARSALVPRHGVLVHGETIWRRPDREGADPWTHRWHGPDNNPFSQDRVFQLPAISKWLGKPYNLTLRRCSDLVAGGRLLIVHRSPGIWKQPDDRANIFICFNAANGQILWQRDLPELFRSGQPDIVLTADTLYMGLGPLIARLDPETGADRDPILIDDAPGHVKWLARSAGRLAVLLGPADTSDAFPERRFSWNRNLKEPNLALSDHGRHLVVLDEATGRESWRRDCGAAVTVRMLAINDGVLYYHAQDDHVAALDLATGTERWRQTDAGILARLHEERSAFDGIVGDADRGLTALPEALVVGNMATSHMCALDPDDGSELWSLERTRKGPFGENSGRVVSWVADEGVMYTGGADRDLRSGQALDDSTRFSLPGCGVLTGSPAGFFGTCGIGWDRIDGQATRSQSDLHKTPCDVGTFVAEGAMFSPGGPCTCDVISRGLHVAMPRGDVVLDAPAEEADRLWRADDLQVEAPDEDSAAWSRWRGTSGTGSATVVLGTALEALWSIAPEHPFEQDLQERRYGQENRPTPPVCAGRLLVYGASDGSLSARDRSSGELRWRVWTSGPILMPPSIADGRVYVGSGDGHLHCHALEDGRPLWRFRAAPSTRLIPVFGHLSSTWPVHTGALVHDGTVFFGAGLLAQNGAHVYALDAEDGSIRWQRNDLGDRADLPNVGRTPLGHIALIGGRVWFQALGIAATAFDPETGERIAVPERFGNERKPQGQMGKDLFAFEDAWVLSGGQRLLADHYERDGSMYKIGRWVRYDFLPLDDAGLPRWPTVALPDSIQAPVWDDDLFVTVTSYRRRLEAWDMPGLRERLRATHEAGRSKDFPFYRAERVPLLEVGRRANEETPMRRWHAPDLDVNCLALSTDAVVVAHAWRAERKAPIVWRLSLLDRADGGETWHADLPGEPLMDGLLIDPQGRVIVPLRDGRLLAFAPGATR